MDIRRQPPHAQPGAPRPSELAVPKSSYLIGVDTGGTYTDAAVIEGGRHKVIASAKALTTKGDPGDRRQRGHHKAIAHCRKGSRRTVFTGPVIDDARHQCGGRGAWQSGRRHSHWFRYANGRADRHRSGISGFASGACRRGHDHNGDEREPLDLAELGRIAAEFDERSTPLLSPGLCRAQPGSRGGGARDDNRTDRQASDYFKRTFFRSRCAAPGSDRWLNEADCAHLATDRGRQPRHAAAWHRLSADDRQRRRHARFKPTPSRCARSRPSCRDRRQAWSDRGGCRASTVSSCPIWVERPLTLASWSRAGCRLPTRGRKSAAGVPWSRRPMCAPSASAATARCRSG